MAVIQTILPNGTPLKRVYAAFFCLVLALTFLNGHQHLLWRLWRISEAPVSTTGTVTALDCPNHGHVDYSFSADGRTWGARQFFIDGANCQRLKIGQRVKVNYEKDAPQNNYALRLDATTTPTGAFLTGVAFLDGFVLVGPLFISLIWAAASRFGQHRS